MVSKTKNKVFLVALLSTCFLTTGTFAQSDVLEQSSKTMTAPDFRVNLDQKMVYKFSDESVLTVRPDKPQNPTITHDKKNHEHIVELSYKGELKKGNRGKILTQTQIDKLFQEVHKDFTYTIKDKVEKKTTDKHFLYITGKEFYLTRSPTIAKYSSGNFPTGIKEPNKEYYEIESKDNPTLLSKFEIVKDKIENAFFPQSVVSDHPYGYNGLEIDTDLFSFHLKTNHTATLNLPIKLNLEEYVNKTESSVHFFYKTENVLTFFNSSSPITKDKYLQGCYIQNHSDKSKKTFALVTGLSTGDDNIIKIPLENGYAFKRLDLKKAPSHSYKIYSYFKENSTFTIATYDKLKDHTDLLDLVSIYTILKHDKFNLFFSDGLYLNNRPIDEKTKGYLMSLFFNLKTDDSILNKVKSLDLIYGFLNIDHKTFFSNFLKMKNLEKLIIGKDSKFLDNIDGTETLSFNNLTHIDFTDYVLNEKSANFFKKIMDLKKLKGMERMVGTEIAAKMMLETTDGALETTDGALGIMLRGMVVMMVGAEVMLRAPEIMEMVMERLKRERKSDELFLGLFAHGECMGVTTPLLTDKRYTNLRIKSNYKLVEESLINVLKEQDSNSKLWDFAFNQVLRSETGFNEIKDVIYKVTIGELGWFKGINARVNFFLNNLTLDSAILEKVKPALETYFKSSQH